MNPSIMAVDERMDFPTDLAVENPSASVYILFGFVC